MCYSNRDLTKPQQSFICYYPCPKCGANIIKKKGGYDSHMKKCKKKTNRLKLTCLRPPKKNTKFFVFYDKGAIHCLTKFGLHQYLNLSPPALQKRLDKGWSINQLLGKEFVEPIPNRRNQHSSNNVAKDTPQPVGTLEKQKLLMKVFKRGK